MLGAMAHVGITVTNMDRSLQFYRDLLGLKLLSDMTFGGEETEKLTRLNGAVLRSVLLRSDGDLEGPPLELLHFVEPREEAGKPYARLTNPGITEVAFWVKDIEKVCTDLEARGVEFYSPPQLFDVGEEGKVKAVYFWDPDGTTLELVQKC